MNHSADRIRMLEGLFLICNFLIFFLPELTIRQENYPEQTFSQFSFFHDYFLSGSGASQISVSGNMRILTLLCILIPVILVIFLSIGSFIDKIPHRYIAIGGILAGVLYLLHLLLAKGIWPKRLNDAQSYDRRIGWWLLAITMLGTLLSAILLLVASIREMTLEKEAMMIEAGRDEQPDVPIISRNNTGENAKGAYGPGDVRDRNPAYNNYAESYEDSAVSQTQTELQILPKFSDEQTAQGTGEIRHPRGVMVGIAGVFRGAEIAMQDGELVNLGRDLSNDLVFQDAPHISRMHCYIIWQAERQKYLLEDHSSNGCYINGALERLPQNVPIALDPGTVVDIGDRTNRFRLE